MKKIACLMVLSCSSLLAACAAEAQAGPMQFDLSGLPGSVSGAVRVGPNAAYSEAAGFGYESGAEIVAGADGRAESAKAFSFSAKVPEGNYTVTLQSFQPAAGGGTATIEAESGRLMLERVPIIAGQPLTFTVNVRTPHLAKLPLNATGREEVSLDPFDAGNARDWDDKLTIKVIAPGVGLGSVEIVPAPMVPTVFLAGDSTVTDRDGGGDVSWGQLLPRFLKPGIAVANEAQSGETLKSFANALRLDKILGQMKKGDYLFVQFGHNDSKASWPQTYAEAATTYKAYLRVYIAEARLRGATPVLVTPMDRGDRKTGAPQHGHGGYVPAMREVAAEEKVTLIDLYAMSDTLYEHAGADAAKILADGTHSTAYGGYEFAKCVVMGIKASGLPLARFVVDDFAGFDPRKPDAAGALRLEGLFEANERRGGAGAGPR